MVELFVVHLPLEMAILAIYCVIYLVSFSFNLRLLLQKGSYQKPLMFIEQLMDKKKSGFYFAHVISQYIVEAIRK